MDRREFLKGAGAVTALGAAGALGGNLLMGCSPTKKSGASEVPAGYESIRLVGSSLGGGATVTVMAFAAILNKYYPEIEWTSSSGAAATNPVYITNGSVKIGFSMLSHYIAAYGFDKIPESRLRSLSQPYPPSNYFFGIPEDKPWKDITAVPKGASLGAGTPGAPSTACEAWLQVCGLSKTDFKWLPLGTTEQAEAWRGGKLDLAFLTVAGLVPALIDMHTSPRKIKAMGLSPQQLAKAQAEQTFERLGFTGVLMSNITQTAGEVFKYDVMCPQMPAFVNCRDDFPEEIAYRIARILDEHNAELVQVYAALKHATPQQHVKWAKRPYDIHPGVARYYKEKGYLK